MQILRKEIERSDEIEANLAEKENAYETLRLEFCGLKEAYHVMSEYEIRFQESQVTIKDLKEKLKNEINERINVTFSDDFL